VGKLRKTTKFIQAIRYPEHLANVSEALPSEPVLTNIIIITITKFVITFTQGIYNYIPETNHVSRVYRVAVVLYLQSVLHVMLFRP